MLVSSLTSCRLILGNRDNGWFCCDADDQEVQLVLFELLLVLVEQIVLRILKSRLLFVLFVELLLLLLLLFGRLIVFELLFEMSC